MPDLVPFVKYREEVYKELQPKKEISSERNIVHAYVDNHEDPNSNNHNGQPQHDQLGPMTRKHFNNNEQYNDSKRYDQSNRLQESNVVQQKWDREAVKDKLIDKQYEKDFSCDPQYPGIDAQSLRCDTKLDNVSEQNKWENRQEFNKGGDILSSKQCSSFRTSSTKYKQRHDYDEMGTTNVQNPLIYNEQCNKSQQNYKNIDLQDYKVPGENFDTDIVEKDSGSKLSKQKYPDIDNEYLQRRTQLSNVSKQNKWENSKEFDQNNYKEIVNQSNGRNGFQNHDGNDIQVISDNSVQHIMDNSESFTHLPQQKHLDNYDGFGTSIQKSLSYNKQRNHSEQYNKNHELQDYKAVEETFNADIVKKDSGYALSNNQKYLDIDNGKLQRGIQFDNVSKQNKWENSKEFDQHNYKEIGKQSNSRNGFRKYDFNDIQVISDNSVQHNMDNSEYFTNLPQQKRLDNFDGI
ncbi:GATA zinc finger domain-containing protein 14-like, partial [Teleopsis dalmanni]